MKVFIDYDTTLIDLIHPWLHWVNQRYNTYLTPNDITRWYFLREELGEEVDDFWKSDAFNWYRDKNVLQPFCGAVDFVKQLQHDIGQENVWIISSTKEHHKLEKLAHIVHYFDIQEHNCLLVGKEKYLYTSNGILIDDYPLHVMEHIHHNQQKGIVFNFNNEFGWAQKQHYETDATLKPFLPTCHSKYFSIHTNYQTILEEICHG